MEWCTRAHAQRVMPSHRKLHSNAECERVFLCAEVSVNISPVGVGDFWTCTKAVNR